MDESEKRKMAQYQFVKYLKITKCNSIINLLIQIIILMIEIIKWFKVINIRNKTANLSKICEEQTIKKKKHDFI